jgi:hypothetical protein
MLNSASLTVLADADPASVPEPATLGLMAAAALGGVAARRRGRKK